MSTLVTFLGKSRVDPKTGYQRTTYRFPGGRTENTAFFGLALSDYLKVDATVILGTCGSQWGVLVESLATEGDEEDLRLTLLDAESREGVEQSLLDRLGPLMSRAVGCAVIPRLIPFGENAEAQYDILAAIADAVPKGTVSIDLTHGFRHLGMIGFLSAVVLERVRSLTVRDLWYGAFDMKRDDNIAPVFQLDGLVRVRRWVEALDRFDATGDYGVFAPLLIEDGVPADKANCLNAAAFYERTHNVSEAARQIGTFRPVLAEALSGASGLFQHRLAERLSWAKEGVPWRQQRKLAYLYLNRRDFVRAAVLAREAWVTQLCSNVAYTDRQAAVKQFEADLKAQAHLESLKTAYWDITNLRNALAHATQPAPRYQHMLKEPDRLHHALESACKRLLG